MHRPLTTRHIWGMPIILDLMSVIGLLSGLLGDGVWDGVSWAGLGLPLTTILWYVLKPIIRPRPRHTV